MGHERRSDHGRAPPTLSRIRCRRVSFTPTNKPAPVPCPALPPVTFAMSSALTTYEPATRAYSSSEEKRSYPQNCGARGGPGTQGWRRGQRKGPPACVQRGATRKALWSGNKPWGLGTRRRGKAQAAPSRLECRGPEVCARAVLMDAGQVGTHQYEHARQAGACRCVRRVRLTRGCQHARIRARVPRSPCGWRARSGCGLCGAWRCRRQCARPCSWCTQGLPSHPFPAPHPPTRAARLL